ncbi:MAG: DUF5939 domain-containing protein, partial [Myxococcales bacterium]
MNSSTLQSRLDAVRRLGNFDPAEVDAFGRFLATAPEKALFRTNPIRYAKKAGIDETRAIDLFLYATHVGLVEMTWGVICGGCAGFLTTPEGLAALAADKTCAMCEVDVPGRLDENVEIAFTVSPSVRRLKFHDPGDLDLGRDGMFTYLSTSVELSPEVQVGYRERLIEARVLKPRESWIIESTHDVPRLALLVPDFHAVTHMSIEEGGASTAEIDVVSGRLVPEYQPVAKGRRTLRITNRTERAVPVGFLIDVAAKANRPACPIAADVPHFRIGPH